jgi:hypothetical protein
MADQDSPHSEEDSDSSLNQGQWQIPFDAAANDCGTESSTTEEPATPKINP